MQIMNNLSGLELVSFFAVVQCGKRRTSKHLRTMADQYTLPVGVTPTKSPSIYESTSVVA